MPPDRVAALFVDPRGVYADLPDVDLWDEQRDARQYAGPWPVVAHPPCARWSRLAGFTEYRYGYQRGDDGGCFESALRSVRQFGGVLEHPAFSDAWKRYDLLPPSVRAGWTLDMHGGATCYVEQGRYGLPVKKATWLYAYGVDLAELRWGWIPDAAGSPLDGAVGLNVWRDRSRSRREQFEPSVHRGPHKGLSATTPPAFRDVLLTMARSARVAGRVDA